MSTPLSWVLPLSFDSRSMFTIPPRPECLGGDPRWLAKAEITHLINRQAIDLPHNRLVDIHKNNSVSNELLEPLLDKIQPKSLLDDSSLDMLCGHQCGFVFPGPIVRLDQ